MPNSRPPPLSPAVTQVAIIDDSDPVVGSLCHYFSDLPNYSVVATSSGDLDAIEQVTLDQTELDVRDLSMPRMTGHQVAAVRHLDPCPHIILVSFQHDDDTKKKSRRLADTFISKIDRRKFLGAEQFRSSRRPAFTPLQIIRP